MNWESIKSPRKIPFKQHSPQVQPLQLGGLLHLLVVVFTTVENVAYWLYGFTIIFLIILGAVSSKTGGSSIKKAVLRITVWGTIAMGLSTLVFYVFGVNV